MHRGCLLHRLCMLKWVKSFIIDRIQTFGDFYDLGEFFCQPFGENKFSKKRTQNNHLTMVFLNLVHQPTAWYRNIRITHDRKHKSSHSKQRARKPNSDCWLFQQPLAFPSCELGRVLLARSWDDSFTRAGNLKSVLFALHVTTSDTSRGVSCVFSCVLCVFEMVQCLLIIESRILVVSVFV